MNRERQDIQARLVDMVLESLPASPPPFVLVAGQESDGFHRGVVGIVAAKVRERTNRPTAIAAIAGPTATASVRSVPAVHAVRALDAASDLLVRYGGHAAAAGFTVESSKLDALRERLCAFVEQHHGDEDLRVVEEVDAVVGGREVTAALARELSRLEPTGKGNPAARVVVEGEVASVRVIKEKHLFFTVDGAPAAWWNAADRAGWLREGRIAVLGEVERDTYGGRDGARLRVEDVA